MSLCRNVRLLASCGLAAVLCVAASAANAAGQKPDPAEAARKLLADCKSVPVPGGAQFMCDGTLATIAELSGEQKLIADSQLGGILTALKGDNTTTEETFKDGDRTWHSIRLQVRRAPGSPAVFEGRQVDLLSAPGLVRISFCGGVAAKKEAQAWCQQLIPLLLDAGPVPLAPAPVEALLLGKKVVVPAGCKTGNVAESSFQISCGETVLASYMKMGSPEETAKMVALITEQLQKALPLKPGPARKCKVIGVEATCSTLVMPGSVFVLGRAVVDGTAVFAQCGQEASREGPHDACKMMLTF